ncbi:MAG: hypothetical protein ACE5EL_08340, partial [Anaerolineae bacterium]
LAAIPGRLHGRGEALPEPMLTPLSAARERAQRRARRWEDAVQGATAAPDPAPAPEPASASARGTRQDRQAPAPGGSSLGAEEQPDTFARLRKAKKRARKG